MFHEASDFPVLPPVRVESYDPALADMVTVQGVTAKSPGDSMEEQSAGVFEHMESLLAEHGMTKHDLVDVKTTICHMPDLIAFNKAFDAWMAGVEVLPAQTACQLLPFAGGVRLALSATATKAPKTVSQLTRPGGGEPAVMIPSKDSAYAAQPMHFPWSKAVRAGDRVWLAGSLDVNAGDEGAVQARGTLALIDATIEELGLTAADVMHTEVLMPTSIEAEEKTTIEAIVTGHYSSSSIGLLLAEQTCAGCKVEITCILQTGA